MLSNLNWIISSLNYKDKPGPGTSLSLQVFALFYDPILVDGFPVI